MIRFDSSKWRLLRAPRPVTPEQKTAECTCAARLITLGDIVLPPCPIPEHQVEGPNDKWVAMAYLAVAIITLFVLAVVGH